jgi:hypothetical protein
MTTKRFLFEVVTLGGPAAVLVTDWPSVMAKNCAASLA